MELERFGRVTVGVTRADGHKCSRCIRRSHTHQDVSCSSCSACSMLHVAVDTALGNCIWSVLSPVLSLTCQHQPQLLLIQRMPGWKQLAPASDIQFLPCLSTRCQTDLVFQLVQSQAITACLEWWWRCALACSFMTAAVGTCVHIFPLDLLPSGQREGAADAGVGTIAAMLGKLRFIQTCVRDVCQSSRTWALYQLARVLLRRMCDRCQMKVCVVKAVHCSTQNHVSIQRYLRSSVNIACVTSGYVASHGLENAGHLSPLLDSADTSLTQLVSRLDQVVLDQRFKNPVTCSCDLG